MAAEMISSAVVGEALNRVVSRLAVAGHGGEDGARGGSASVERLEIAHSRMEAVLELSTRWPVTDVSLLRWRRRLKRAAEECDGAVRRRKQRAVAEAEAEAARRPSSSLPRRVARATMSLVSALLVGGRDDGGSADDVRRFERLADGAGEFLKLVELGGTRPRQHAFFDPLIGRLLAGETLSYLSLSRGSRLCYLGVRPVSFEERGVEAMVGFVVQDFAAPARSFNLGLMVRLSERTDLLGTMIDCMQSASSTTHFRVVAEDIRRELVQLPTQDFTWMPRSPYAHTKYWVDVHTTLTRWYRPNPLCCTTHQTLPRDTTAPSPSPSPAAPLSAAYPEHVIQVYLHCCVPAAKPAPAAACNNNGEREQTPPPPPLELTVLFLPHDHHGTHEDRGEEEEDGATKRKQHPSSPPYHAVEVVDEDQIEARREQQHADGGGACRLQDLDERLLPRAVDHLRTHTASRTYQVCLRSGHGAAHVCVEKATNASGGGGSTPRGEGRRRSRSKMRMRFSVEGWRDMSARPLLKLWVVRESEKLRASISSWTIDTISHK